MRDEFGKPATLPRFLVNPEFNSTRPSPIPAALLILPAYDRILKIRLFEIPDWNIKLKTPPTSISADQGGVIAAAFRLNIPTLSPNLQRTIIKSVKVVPQKRQL